MLFHELVLKNVLTISSAKIYLNGRGLNVIQGSNDDDSSASSNGAGKSSIVDGLCWCLQGITARGVKGDAIVNRSAKKDAIASVLMQSGDNHYRVTRYRKHKEHKNALRVLAVNMLDGSEVDLSKGTDAETQKVVDKLLGCSQEVFLAAVYSGQEIMPDLPRMTDRELKRLIEEGAGLQQIEAAYEEARVRLRAVSAESITLDTRIDQVKVTIERNESGRMIKQAEEASWDAGRAARVQESKTRLDAVKATFAKLASDVTSLKPKHDELGTELASIDGVLANYSVIDHAVRAEETAATRAEGEIAKVELQRAVELIRSITGQIENAPSELAKPCHECGKPHTPDELETYVAHQSVRLAEAQAALEQTKVKVQAQVANANQLRTRAQLARSQVPDVTAANTRRAEIILQRDAFDERLQDLRRLKQDVDAVQLALVTRESEVNPFTSAVQMLNEQIVKDSATLGDLHTRRSELAEKIAVAEAVVKVFGPSGVRAHILDTVTPFLNERTADYLSALSDGAIQATWTTLSRSASGDLKEKFSIEVAHAEGGESFSALSGGEKRKVRLATALALQDLVASRASQPIDLWIGDEIDDALDPAGLERLMTILERKARERGTVLVISHNDLSDWADQITTVRKKCGSSTVEGALCD